MSASPTSRQPMPTLAEGSFVSKQQSTSSVVTFMRNLDQLQEQQIIFTEKLENEKKRKDILSKKLSEARVQCRELREQTQNGVIINEDDKVHRKRITRLEKQLQTAKIKLSVTRRDNHQAKLRIDGLRKDKLLHLQIKNDLEREHADHVRRIKHVQREIGIINSKKHSTDIAIVNTKHSIIREMEEFSRELSATKQNISRTQEVIFGTIRDKLQATFDLAASQAASRQQTRGTKPIEVEVSKAVRDEAAVRADLVTFLEHAGVHTVDELVIVLDQSEEKIFASYNDVQTLSRELEKIDLENKHLEQQLGEEMSQLDSLEKHNVRVRKELEQHISQIQKSIAKFDDDYAKNMDVLSSISESLMNLLRNVAVEGEALDQQLLSTGITDRNINELLGLVEQRIDELIQMSNAANHHPMHLKDLLRASQAPAGIASLRPPQTLPSLADLDDDDDGIPTSAVTAAAAPVTAASAALPGSLGAAIGLGEDAAKLQPINISMLKEYMQKKVQKAAGIVKKQITPGAVDPHSPRLQNIKPFEADGFSSVIP